jgi:hypothetical protein
MSSLLFTNACLMNSFWENRYTSFTASSNLTGTIPNEIYVATFSADYRYQI